MLLFLLLFTASMVAQAATAFAPDAEQEIIRLVNRERQSRGLATLVIDEQLREAARKHTALMAASGEVEHKIGSEPKLQRRLGALRFDASGENVALAGDAARAHTALMNSPGHRANILDADYNSIGVGVVSTAKGIYVTEDFARRLPDETVEEAEGLISNNLNRLRSAAGMPILVRVAAPELRKRACGMAVNNKLDPHAGVVSSRVSNSVAFTAIDLTRLPDSLARLKTQSASGFSVGACYHTSASYENPVFWIIVVTYF